MHELSANICEEDTGNTIHINLSNQYNNHFILNNTTAFMNPLRLIKHYSLNNTNHTSLQAYDLWVGTVVGMNTDPPCSNLVGSPFHAAYQRKMKWKVRREKRESKRWAARGRENTYCVGRSWVAMALRLRQIVNLVHNCMYALTQNI